MPPGGKLSHLLLLLLPPDRIGRQERRQLATGISTSVYHTALGINLHTDNVPLDPVGLEGNGMALGL